jgi:hypothetical protein
MEKENLDIPLNCGLAFTDIESEFSFSATLSDTF